MKLTCNSFRLVIKCKKKFKEIIDGERTNNIIVPCSLLVKLTIETTDL